MKSRKISVHTENIFPIIKKFLYTDHEVFLRELISNAVDATQKLKALSSIGEYKGELGDLTIEVKLDKEAKTLSIIDKGIGLTQEEIEKYINQLAFSGAEEFLQQYKDKTDTAVIGHFGLGFYSAFMVANKVEIYSLSRSDDAKPAYWVCEGNTDIKMGEGTKAERGTEIILHLNDDSLEFNDSFRIKNILDKYCRFLPVKIKFEDKIINEKEPIWTKKPQELKEDDYQDLYKTLYPFEPESLFHIHLNVDYPFNLTGILYFPKISNRFEPERHKVQLYSNQVFVTDNVKDILPDYLVLLQGIIDSPDIPLNVSRSALQSDGNVKKITSYISKKVADKLTELFKNDRKDFETKWENLGLFVKYGMVSDEKFYDKAKDFCLLKDVDSNFMTIEEFENKAKEIQTNKDKKTVLLYSTDSKEQALYVKQAKDNGYIVIELDGPVDSYFIGKLEEKNENLVCRRVDSDTLDKLVDKGVNIESVCSKEDEEKLKELFTSQAETGFEVETTPMSASESPVVITEGEFDRRFREMYANQSAMFGTAAMGTQYKVKVNVNHPVMKNILGSNDEIKKDLVGQLLDLALLSKNLLKGEKMANFVNRSIELMNK
ncbi:MAG: molecular chaperone HtpG [Bacteroidetes bacterium]|nr:molecular chaperone HtpG [Bacteroidota bacterium]